MKKYDAVALGEALIDFTYSGVSSSGQKLFEQNPGGAPVNMLAAMARCGMNTAFIGKLGNDMHGEYLKKTLDKAGIDTRGVILSDEWFTTLAFVDINEKGERNFSFARKPGADIMLNKEDIDLNIIQNTKILHVGSLSLTHEPSKSATFYAIKKAKEAGTIISYDPNYRASLWNSKEEAIKEMKSVIPFADMMKISDEETVLITGTENVEDAAETLIALGVSIVAVTLGEKGVYIKTANFGKYIKGFKSKVVDTTGAGDSFWGGFLHKFIKSKNSVNSQEILDAGIFGNALASLCVEKRGGIPAMPSLEEIIKRCETFNEY